MLAAADADATLRALLLLHTCMLAAAAVAFLAARVLLLCAENSTQSLNLQQSSARHVAVSH